MSSDRLSLLFEPCDTKEELRLHMKVFLKIELPDVIVDEDSNSTPLDFCWAIYSMLHTNIGETSHVVAASRNSGKTLTSAILHFYAMVHFRRSCLHLAATYDQSVSCINYLNKFLTIPELKEYSSVDNARLKSLANLPATSFTSKPDAALRIAIASLKGSNSQRCSFLILDELDLVPASIISEVMGTSDPTPEGFEPVAICLSSRKTNDGPVQQMLDDATDPTKGIRVHKWSLADWMHKCPETTHKPELPRKKALLNLDTLEVVWDQGHQESLMSKGTTSQYKEIVAYDGCEKCPAFVACQARAPKQTSKTKMLRSIKFVGDILRKVRDSGIIISQYLNLKPETSGIVYKAFNPEKHVKSPIALYQWITGVAFNPRALTPEAYKEHVHSKSWADRQKVTPSKDELYYALVKGGWDISFGVDWGYSPAPAVCVVGAHHKKTQRACVFHVEYANGYDNRSWADHVSLNIWPRFTGSFLAPDMEDPASPSYFGKYRIPTINTKPHLIVTGVSQMRGFLWNVSTQLSHFAILDDGEPESGLKRTIEAYQKWTHKRTPTGYDFNRFEDNDFCDFCDPCRYLFAPYVKEINVSLSAKQPSNSAMDRYRADSINLLPPEKRGEALQAHAKNQLESFFRDNHGLEKIFDKEKKLKDWEQVQKLNADLAGKPMPEEEDNGLKTQKKSGIKISF